MKKIEAIIRTSKFEDVKQALEKIDVRGMTVSEVSGYGMQKGHKAVYRGQEYNISLNPKIKLELVVEEKFVEQIVNRIIKSAYTGEVGDGKVFVYPVEKAIRIRTGEYGEDAI